MNNPELNTTGAIAHLLRRALIFDHIRDAVVVVGLDGRIIDWNGGAERLFGWKREEVLGRSPALLISPPVRPERSEEGEASWTGENMFVRKDGKRVICESTIVPLRDARGKVFARLAVHHDVMRRRQAERQLNEERTLLRTLIDAVPDPIFCKDRDGRYLLTNRAHQSLFNQSDLLGKTTAEVPELAEFAGIYEADDRHVLESGEAVINREEPHIRTDGCNGLFLISKFPLRDSGGAIIGLVGICRDITDLKRASQELEQARQRLVDHVENSPLAVIEWQPDFRVERWAGQAQAIFGWRPDEVSGKHYRDWPFIHPEDADRVDEVSTRLLDGRELRNISHHRHLTKGGRVIHCLWQNSALRDDSGEIVSILSLVQDVTERVQAEEAVRAAEAERATIERKLLETQKLESLGVLAGGIAHDFNNLLTGVLGNASLAAMDLDPDSPIQPCLEQIELAATRAADLCKQMLAYSGKGRFVVRRLDLNHVIRETTNLLQISISKNAVLKFDLENGIPAVLADATQIRQIIMNLVINASEAIVERSGVIRVSTGIMRANRAYFAVCHLTPELPDGDYVFLEVADNGAGMAPEVRARIFDPFFTTKFTGRGLGLAAVLGIVRGHSGALRVESAPNYGTSFRILFPCAAEPAEDLGVAPAADSAWRGQGTALIIDDEETVRTTAARMLEQLGFRVVMAVDGVDGVAKFTLHSAEISIVMLDLTMPRMDGEDTLRELRRMQPEVRVLLMSGFTEQEAVARFADKGIAGFLQKPFKIAALREKLRLTFADQLVADSI